MSLEVLDTLDACLERAAATYAALDRTVKVSLIGITLGRVMELEAAHEAQAPAGGAPNQALLWMSALAGASATVQQRLAAVLDHPGPVVAEHGEAPLTAAVLGAEHAGVSRLAEAFVLALLTTERLDAQARAALAEVFATIKTSEDAPDLPASLAAAARRLLDAATPDALRVA